MFEIMKETTSNECLKEEEEFSIIHPNVGAYLEAKTESEIIAALKGPAQPFSNQAVKTVKWEGEDRNGYTVELSDDPSFARKKTYLSETNEFSFPGVLIPGSDYYWRVKAKSGEVLKDGSFHVSSRFCLRTITIDGVNNVRDIGGWRTKDGKKAPYGKIYRGATLAGITKKGRDVFVNELGIKTEIDLRGEGKDELKQDGVEYLHVTAGQYTIIIPGFFPPLIKDRDYTDRNFNAELLPAIKTVFEKFADPAAYPIYLHCAAGADRTATIVFLLNGLLGVPYEELVKDFELTTFSLIGPHYRSAIINDSFDKSGISQNDVMNYVAFDKMYELLLSNYSNDDGDLAFSIERYLKEVVGIGEETINSIRKNILG